MTDQQINAAIAELCGWKLSSIYNHIEVTPNGSVTLDVFEKDGRLKTHKELPDYCNDLNSMHEAFEAIHISKIDLLEHYLGELTLTEGLTMRRSFVGERYKLFTATARQRAEALLRAHGKWEEVKP